MGTSIAKDSAILAVSRTISFLIAAITPFILVRTFNLTEYGEYRQVMLMIGTAAAIIPLGMIQSLYYFFPHFPKDKNIYLSRVIFNYVISGLVLFFVILLSKDLISTYFHNPRLNNYRYLICIAAISLSMSLIVDTVLIVEKKVKLLGMVLNASSLIRGVVIVSLSLWYNVAALLYGLIAWWSIKTVISIIYFNKEYKLFPFSIILSESKPQYIYALPIAFGGLLCELTQVVDKFLISNYLGTDQFAIYAVGCYEIPLLVIVFQSIGDVILPRIVEFKSKNDIDGVIRTWHNASESSFLFAWPILTFSLLFADQIIPLLFTKTYISAVPVFRITLLSILLAATRHGVITRAYAKTWVDLLCSFIAFCLMVPICIIGIKYYGLVGAASALIFGKTVEVAMLLIYSKYLLHIQYSQLLPFKKAAYFGLISIILAFLLRYLAGDMNNSALVKIIVFGILHVGLFAYITNYLKYWRLESVPLPASVKSYLKFIYR